MISLDKCKGSCNIVDDLSTKTCSEWNRDVNVKSFNMITRINEAKTLTIHIFHVIVDANSIVKHGIQIKHGIMININASIKRIVRAKKIIVRIVGR